MTVEFVALAPVLPVELGDWLGPIAAAGQAARAHSAESVALILGGDQIQLAAAETAGADCLVRLSHPGLHPQRDEDQIAAVFAEALGQLDVSKNALVFVPVGPFGDRFGAKLAQMMGFAVVGLCHSVERTEQGWLVRRSTYGGRAQIGLEINGRFFLSLRNKPTANEPTAATRELVLSGSLPSALPILAKDSGVNIVNLEGANIVVSGGRGMGGEDGFALLAQLASSLGGALGGSLPAVDAGWAPVFRQVGCSGKFVTPEVYVAVGISGTVQHLAGIGAGARIVAINKDAEADIFKYATVGIVGEWQEVLPQLVAALRS
jgi:electron transfer flavoprotein alpha subunit